MRSSAELLRLMREAPAEPSLDEYESYHRSLLILGCPRLGIAPLREPPPVVPAWLERRHGVSPLAKALRALIAEKRGMTRRELYAHAGAVDLEMADLLWSADLDALARAGLVRADASGRMVAVGAR